MSSDRNLLIEYRIRWERKRKKFFVSFIVTAQVNRLKTEV